MSDLFWAKFFSKQTTVIKFFPFVFHVNIEEFMLMHSCIMGNQGKMAGD